jgi:RimJ/RimL family protein N-acetyltransferase
MAIRDAVTANTEVTHVSALAVADNLASIAVMKKIGMTFVKAYLHKDPIGDFDAVHYQMPLNQ